MSLDLVYRMVSSCESAQRTSDAPAIILIFLIKGRHKYTMLEVVEDKGPGSSQNILSTPWC